MPKNRGNSGRGQRDLTVKVKTARGRKLSSTLWLQRQLNDPYVRRAKAEGSDRLTVADRGLREGLLYSLMSTDGVLVGGPF